MTNMWPADRDRATMFHRLGEVSERLAVRPIVDFAQASEQAMDRIAAFSVVLGSAAVAAACFSSSGCAGAGPDALFAVCLRIISPRASPLKNSADECRRASAGALRAEVSSSPRPSQPSSTS